MGAAEAAYQLLEKMGRGALLRRSFPETNRLFFCGDQVRRVEGEGASAVKSETLRRQVHSVFPLTHLDPHLRLACVMMP